MLNTKRGARGEGTIKIEQDMELLTRTVEFYTEEHIQLTDIRSGEKYSLLTLWLKNHIGHFKRGWGDIKKIVLTVEDGKREILVIELPELGKVFSSIILKIYTHEKIIYESNGVLRIPAKSMEYYIDRLEPYKNIGEYTLYKTYFKSHLSKIQRQSHCISIGSKRCP